MAEGELKQLSPEKWLECHEKEVLPKMNAFFDYIHGIELNNPLVSEKMEDEVQYSLNQFLTSSGKRNSDLFV